LETSIERLDAGNVKLTVTIAAQQVDEQVSAAYKQASKTRIPGFRPGRAPRKVLDNHFGGREYFLAMATEELVNSTVAIAADTEGLVMLGKPEFEDSGLVTEGQGYTYSIKAEVTPAFELSSYEPVRIELPSAQPTDEEMQQQLDSLREYYVEYEDVFDRPVQDCDSLVIHFNTAAEDEAADAALAKGDGADDAAPADADGADDADAAADAADDADADAADEGSDTVYNLGSKMMPEAFEAALIGMRIGERKEIDVSIPSEGEGEEKATDLKASVTLKSIRLKKLPELTDEWIQEALGEYESLEDLKADIAARISEEKSAGLPGLRESQCVEKLAARLEGAAPETMVKQIEKRNYQDFFKSLQNNRLSFDQYLSAVGQTSAEFRSQMTARSELDARVELALDALARHEGFTATDEEVLEEFKKSGAENPEELLASWAAQGRLSEVREGILRMKASRHLIDGAEVFEPGTLPEEPALAEALPDAKLDAQGDGQAGEQAGARDGDVKDAAADDGGSDERTEV
jgi:trigger factor